MLGWGAYFILCHIGLLAKFAIYIQNKAKFGKSIYLTLF